MHIVIMVGQFLLAISILVGLHELGHLLFAKWFGMRVEKYFIGFPPKVFSFKWGETEYGLGAIPMGGFVKISGMVDESLDTAKMSGEPESWEFRSKPAWQRLLVMLGGIIFNVITGVAIFTMLTWHYGETYVPASEAKYGIVASEPAKAIGLQDYDKIISVNGQPIDRFYEVLTSEVLLGTKSYYTVERNGQQIRIDIPSDLAERLSEERFQKAFMLPAATFSVGQLRSGMPGEKAGLQVGDRITAINGTPIRFFNELQNKLKEVKGQKVNTAVTRGGVQLFLTIEITSDALIGFQPKLDLVEKKVEYSLVESLPRGWDAAMEVVFVNIKGLSKVFTGEVSAGNAFQGPVAMAQDLFGGVWDWQNFWRMTGLLSMALAFMNLLPIPALDGGHCVFLLYEMILRRKPSDKFLENAQKVGMVMLLSLMGFVIFNDIFKRIF